MAKRKKPSAKRAPKKAVAKRKKPTRRPKKVAARKAKKPAPRRVVRVARAAKKRVKKPVAQKKSSARVRAGREAAITRKVRAEVKRALRSRAAIQGVNTRRKNAAKVEARARLREMKRAFERDAPAEHWDKIRPKWHAAKRALMQALHNDYEEYAEFLDSLAYAEHLDWVIDYGPDQAA